MRTFKSIPGTEVAVAGQSIKFNSEGIFKASDEKIADALAKTRYVEELKSEKKKADESKGVAEVEPKDEGKKGKA